MKKTWAFLLVAAMLYACGDIAKEGVRHEESFDFKDSTSANCSSSIKIGAMNVWNWQTNGGKIYIQTSGQDSVVRILNYPDTVGGQVYFGRVGHAKGEFIVTNWCETESGFGLYDMMQKKLFLYDMVDGKVFSKSTYSLPLDKEGRALPYTYVSQFNDSLFLMKRDGMETDLCLVNMKSGKEISSYHCDIRPKDDRPYTPYSYVFAHDGNTICMAYEHLDRVEFVDITDDMQLKATCIIGEDGKREMPSDYSKLKRCFSCIAKHDGLFYCLRYSGNEKGSRVYVFGADGEMRKVVKLDRKVSRILVSNDGNLLGYAEDDNSGEILVYRMK